MSLSRWSRKRLWLVIIGLRDLTKASDIVASRTYDYFVPLILAACVYLVIVLGLTRLVRMFERRLAQSDYR